MKSLQTTLTRGQWRHLWKSASGAAIAVAIGNQLDRLEPDIWSVSDTTWSAVTVLVVLQANLGGLLQASSSRLQGTIIGGTCGTLVGLLVGFTPWSAGVAVFFSLAFCLTARLNDALRLAGLTSLIVQSSFAIGVSQPWLVGLGRLTSVFVGIAIAVGVSLLLWPRPALLQLEQGLRSLFADAAQLYAALNLSGEQDDAIAEPQRLTSLQLLRQQLRRNRQSLQETQHEPWLDLKRHSQLELQAREADTLVFALHALVELRREGPLPADLAIAELDHMIQQALQKLAETLSLPPELCQQLASVLEAQLEHLRVLRQQRALRSLDESDLLRGLALLQERSLISRLLLRLGGWPEDNSFWDPASPSA
ncbi:FUSC family protein [Synechococcus elongatus]|uniref:FUSC family protein n=1 Tax=Synechococcus elongatus PCC 11802 TaxID=2283154 RepID=A0AAT9JZY0_SYNEL|nr:FUSC family protein [Synechococcus elongatus]QFZ92939.1 FUSC family protein [Synechococcus elongatus PCC 11802]